MRILDTRDGFIKIETDEKVSLSSFLQINDIAKRYIAQIIQTKRLDNKTIAVAKILFLYDGTLGNYDKTLPSKNSEVIEFPFEILSKSHENQQPIIAGKFIDRSIDIPIEKNCFDKKMLICVDTPSVNNKILSNLTKQFSHLGKTLIIDMLGIVEGVKYTAGVDFKLPLNTASLDFMYEDCLNDATSDSKSLIKEIFQDLSEYSKTVSFLPFETLKTIIDDMVDKQHVFKLLILKNKLSKFAQQGYFATSVNEAQNLKKILEEQNVVIDLSKLEPIFQNRYLETIYSLLNKTQVFIEVSNTLSKKNIKNILENDSVPTTFITHSNFKYINEIKTMFENFIIEPSFTNNEVFKSYVSFLNAMPKETYLLVGKGTNYIPLVSTLEAVVNLPQVPVKQEETVITEDLESEVSIESDYEGEAPLLRELEERFEENLNPTDIAINQKADELIEKISEEVTSVEIENIGETLFEEDDDNEGESESSELIEEDLEPVLKDEEVEDSAIEKTSFIETEDYDLVQDEEITESFGDSDFHTEVDEVQSITLPEEISDFAEDIEEDFLEEQETLETDVEETSFEQELQVESFEYNKEEEISEEIETTPDVIPLEEDSDFDNIIDETELDETDEDPIFIDFDETKDDIEDDIEDDELDKQIVEDVDKVFTTIREDSISDSDLDFIDELNEEGELGEQNQGFEDLETDESIEDFSQESEEEGFLEPLEEYKSNSLDMTNDEKILETKDTKTPIVPVYDAEIPQEDTVHSDPLEQGDLVVHAKYGNGVVEKMIKYGAKTLFSINFDNVGRRLLDPTLTEIKKA